MAKTDDTVEGLDGLIEEAGGSSEFDWGAEELEDDAGEEIDVLRFALGSALFAVEGRFVKEVVGDVAITPLPGAPPHIAGIGVIKRQVIGVLDLARWFGLEADEPDEDATPRLVIMEAGESLTVGIEADQVLGIEPWPATPDIASLPESVSGKLRSFSRGARWAPGGVVILLDIERILEESAVR